MSQKVTYLFLASLVINIILIGILYTKFFYANNLKNTQQSNKTNTVIKKWYDVAESPRYKIYVFTGGTAVSVLDKEKQILLTPDDTCEVNIPESIVQQDPFYNSSVGIKIQGPYKAIYHKESNTFRQSFFTAGCSSNEGEITLTTNEDTWMVSCDVEIKYEFLSC